MERARVPWAGGGAAPRGESIEEVLQRQRQALRDASYLKALRRAEEDTARMLRDVAQRGDVDDDADEAAAAAEYEAAQRRERAAALVRQQKAEHAAFVQARIDDRKREAEAERVKREAVLEGGSAEGSASAAGAAAAASKAEGDASAAGSGPGAGGIVLTATSAFSGRLAAVASAGDEDESITAKLRRLAKARGSSAMRNDEEDADEALIRRGAKSEPGSASSSSSSSSSAAATAAAMKDQPATVADAGDSSSSSDDDGVAHDHDDDDDDGAFAAEPLASGGAAAALALFRSRGVVKPAEKREEGPVLRYTDDDGNELDTKAAYKYLSGKFHGTKAGFKKQEKERKKKLEAERLRKAAEGLSFNDRVYEARSELGQVALIVDERTGKALGHYGAGAGTTASSVAALRAAAASDGARSQAKREHGNGTLSQQARGGGYAAETITVEAAPLGEGPAVPKGLVEAALAAAEGGATRLVYQNTNAAVPGTVSATRVSGGGSITPASAASGVGPPGIGASRGKVAFTVGVPKK